MHNAATFPDPEASAQPRRSRRPIVFAAIIVVLIMLIAGIAIPLFAPSLFGTHNTLHGITPTVASNPGGKGSTVTPVVTRTTGQFLTICPAAGSARAAIVPPFTSGNDANVVYIVNEGTASAPTFGTVKRHDVVTGNSTEIIKTSNTTVTEAQVSNDGQWVLYNAVIAGQDELRLIRVDGQRCTNLAMHTGWAIHL